MKRLIHEAHRRSLWQVLGVYLAVSWLALQIVDVLVSNFGLPDWVPPASLVLLVLGLPIVMATAFVQEGIGGRAAAPDSRATRDDADLPSIEPPEGAPGGSPAAAPSPPGNLAAGTGSLDRPSTRPSRMARLLTWRNAIAGGILAFAALGALVVAYWVMWRTGVGPVGSLVAQGVLEVDDPVILADFDNGTPDPLMGDLVTSTLRVDLVESPVISLLEPAQVQEVLRRMERDADLPLTAEVAREVALREGIKAVIEGQVRAAGASYLLAATVRAAQDGRSLAAFRVTADRPEEVVDAIDELSQRIRERAGESLRTIRAGEPLEGATTSSLEALRKLTEAERLTYQGDDPGAIALLEEAIAIDTTFAMAYRKLGILLGNNGIEAERQIQATTRAYELRSRLTDRERYLTEADYYCVVTLDWDACERAYRAVLRSHPNDVTALNNLGLMYRGNDLDEAEVLFERAVRMGTADVAFQNLAGTYVRQNRPGDALTVAERFAEVNPENPRTKSVRGIALAFSADAAGARSLIEEFRDDPAASRIQRIQGHEWLAWLALREGKAAEARIQLERAVRDSEELGPAQELLRVIRLASVDIELALDRRRALATLDAALQSGLLEEAQALDRPYLELGRLFARAGEVERAEALLERWQRDVPPQVTPKLVEAQQAWVRALLAERSGDYPRAESLMEESRRGLHCTLCGTTDVARMKAAAAPDPAEAIAAWEERAGMVDFSLGTQLWTQPLVYEQLCTLYAQQDNAAKAVDYCGLFVEIWADADPELQPRVEAARRALEAAARVAG